VAVMIFLQHWKLMIIAKPPDDNHNWCAFFGYEITRQVNLFSDRNSHVGHQPGQKKPQNIHYVQQNGQIE
jgi:hypothetical protein